jgi:hypothetical protein
MKIENNILHLAKRGLPFVSPAFEEVSIDNDGHISTRDASLLFIVKTWIIHCLTGSEVYEQKEITLD